jgi:hypothetical protein
MPRIAQWPLTRAPDGRGMPRRLVGLDRTRVRHLGSDPPTDGQNGIALVPTDFPVDGYLALHGALAPTERHGSTTLRSVREEQMRHDCEKRESSASRSPLGQTPTISLAARTRGEASKLIVLAYRDAGLSPLDIIRAATVNAAELLGNEGSCGCCEGGHFADLIGVVGDPTKDITLLHRCSL